MVSDKIKEVNSRYIFIGGGIGAKNIESTVGIDI